MESRLSVPGDGCRSPQKMIDRTSRDRLAESLRQLCAGTLTIDDFDSRIDRELLDSSDRGVQAVITTALDLLDPESLPLTLKRFRGRNRLPNEIRRQVVTATIFLHSDLEFEWPVDLDYPRWHECFFLLTCALLASCGLFCVVIAPLIAGLLLVASVYLFFHARTVAQRLLARWVTRQREFGRDYDVWPFLRRSDFQRQLAKPKLLSGVE